MGSPLSPSLANFFLGHLEEKLFQNASECVWGSICPKFYIRYVDDIFAVFDKNVPCEMFLDHINNQHPNIKFTVEKSINSLSFLDTEIKISGDNFESWTYRKKTDTGVLLNLCAVCPRGWKKGLIFGALSRAKVICSSRELFLQEIDKLRNIFWKNGYSAVFFNKVFESFEQRQNRADIDGDTDRDSIDMKYIVKIPYIGSLSHEFKNKITKLFYNDLRVNITPVFNTFKVSRYFSLKSQTPKILTSNVVYKFTCLCDTNLTYIGKTKRHLKVRSLEHLEFEDPKPESEIKTHLMGCEICRNAKFENFEIIKKCTSDHETKINEAMFIKKETPSLNKNVFNSGSLYTLKVYV